MARERGYVTSGSVEAVVDGVELTPTTGVGDRSPPARHRADVLPAALQDGRLRGTACAAESAGADGQQRTTPEPACTRAAEARAARRDDIQVRPRYVDRAAEPAPTG